jgi:hypothetical protein
MKRGREIKDEERVCGEKMLYKVEAKKKEEIKNETQRTRWNGNKSEK